MHGNALRQGKEIALWGYGYVGQAVANTLSNKHKLHIVDPPKGYPINLGAVSMEAAVLALPAPTVDGNVDHSIICDAINRIRKVRKDCKILIKSTISPEFASYLKDDEHITFSPEFLTAENANEDFANSPKMIFAGEDGYWWADLFADLIPGCKFYFTDHVTAAVMKYTMNCFLAIKLSFLNEVNDMYVDLTGKKWDNLQRLLETDPRMGPSHNVARGGWGGACFPKDTEAFANMGDMQVLKAARQANMKWRKNESSHS